MTCIVGYTTGKKVYIGGDSLGSNNYTKAKRKDEKVFENKGFLFGCTSSFRMIQILRYSFTPPKRKGKDLFKYMCTDFIDAVRASFKEKGFLMKESKGDELGGVFLVGHQGRLFKIDCDFQVSEHIDPYTSCGSGKEVSIGAMYAMKKESNPKEKIIKALKAAERFSVGVEGPFIVKSI